MKIVAADFQHRDLTGEIKGKTLLLTLNADLIQLSKFCGEFARQDGSEIESVTIHNDLMGVYRTLSLKYKNGQGCDLAISLALNA